MITTRGMKPKVSAFSMQLLEHYGLVDASLPVLSYVKSYYVPETAQTLQFWRRREPGT